MADSNGIRTTIHHYCGVEAFRKILARKRLWVSDAYYMNDYLEHKLILNKAVKRLNSLATGPKNGEFYGKLAQSLTNPLLTSFHPYVCCFSGKDDLLSQWRAYSDDGAGFAIGFSTKRLDLHFESAHNKWMGVQIVKVEYDADKQDELLDKEIEQRLARYLELCVKPGFDEGRCIAHAHACLWELATKCKGKGFAEEDEYRMVTCVTPIAIVDKPGGQVAEIDASKMSFRVSGKRIVPFYTFRFGVSDVVAIRLGPKNAAREMRYSLEMFLRRHGYDIDPSKIRNSETSYR